MKDYKIGRLMNCPDVAANVGLNPTGQPLSQTHTAL